MAHRIFASGLHGHGTRNDTPSRSSGDPMVPVSARLCRDSQVPSARRCCSSGFPANATFNHYCDSIDKASACYKPVTFTIAHIIYRIERVTQPKLTLEANRRRFVLSLLEKVVGEDGLYVHSSHHNAGCTGLARPRHRVVR